MWPSAVNADGEGLFDSPTLAQAKTDLWADLRAGTTCPCCGQYAKMYRRTLNAQMVRVLTQMWHCTHSPAAAWRGRADVDGWVHLPTLLFHRHADEAKMAYWGLIEEAAAVRADGGRAGWWRLTELGQQFVTRTAKVPKYALVYNGHCHGLEGPAVDIVDCLGTTFNYHDLMEN